MQFGPQAGRPSRDQDAIFIVLEIVMSYAKKKDVPAGAFKSTGARNVAILTRRQAALTAAQTALQIGDIEQIIDLAVELIQGFDKPGEDRKAAAHIDARVKALNEGQRFVAKHDFLRDSKQDISDHCAYVMSFLSARGNDEVAGLFEPVLLRKAGLAGSETYELDRHARRLDRLKLRDPALYRFVIEGRLGEAAALFRRQVSEAPMADLALTIRIQAYLLALRTVLDFAQVLNRLALTPLGQRFKGKTVWLTTATVLAESVCAPARIVVEIAKRGQSIKPQLSFQDTVAIATQNDWLPATAEGLTLASIASRVEERLNTGEKLSIDRLLAALAEAARRVEFSREALQARGFARRDFCHTMMGLTIGEAVTYLSVTMLRALAQVDEVTERLFPGANLPRKRRAEPPNADIRLATGLLRADAELDRCVVRHIQDLDAATKSGRKSLQSLRCALERAAVRAKAEELIHVPVADWFETRR